MKIDGLVLLAALLAGTGDAIVPPYLRPGSSPLPPPVRDFLFRNPTAPEQEVHGLRIPTSRESAVLARRILALTPHGVFSTVFPPSDSASPPAAEEEEEEEALPLLLENRPPGVGGAPVGLMDYVADCGGDGDDGNPTVLAITIATSFKNARAGSNVSLALEWTPRFPPERLMSSSSSSSDDEETGPFEPAPYSAAALPRFSLIGYFERLPGVVADPVEAARLARCFTSFHPDSRYWLPGNPIHHSEWQRLVVTAVYWIGGFGDRAYIGWIPVDEWSSVTREEWEAVELPGEKKGWKEWQVQVRDGGGAEPAEGWSQTQRQLEL